MGWKFFKYMTWQYLKWSIVSYAYITVKVNINEGSRMVLGNMLGKFWR